MEYLFFFLVLGASKSKFAEVALGGLHLARRPRRGLRGPRQRPRPLVELPRPCAAARACAGAAVPDHGVHATWSGVESWSGLGTPDPRAAFDQAFGHFELKPPIPDERSEDRVGSGKHVFFWFGSMITWCLEV